MAATIRSVLAAPNGARLPCSHSWSEEERAALENVHKLIHVGDERRLEMWTRLASLESPVDEPGRRLARMLFAVLYGKEIAAGTRAEALWAEHALLREEIAGLVPVLRELNAVLTEPHTLAAEIASTIRARCAGVRVIRSPSLSCGKHLVRRRAVLAI